MTDNEIEKKLKHELRDIMPNVIIKFDNGHYELFGRYRIITEKPLYRVLINDEEVGSFNSTKTAVSWCVADKYGKFNLARDIMHTDLCLGNLANDIFVRAGIASKSKHAQFAEDIETKLETKIIRKKYLESQLADYVKKAKYLQQRGFNNETARIGQATTDKSRSSI
jgi:hypothetical protein